jgi:hypothetical protein
MEFKQNRDLNGAFVRGQGSCEKKITIGLQHHF